MSVTRESRSIQMTAANDAVTEPLHIKEIWFGGAGLTAGQRLTVLEEASGSVVIDHYIGGTNINELVRANCFSCKGLVATAWPASGGILTIYLE